MSPLQTTLNYTNFTEKSPYAISFLTETATFQRTVNISAPVAYTIMETASSGIVGAYSVTLSNIFGTNPATSKASPLSIQVAPTSIRRATIMIFSLSRQADGINKTRQQMAITAP